jgi:SAM-dependent methyltransferase
MSASQPFYADDLAYIHDVGFSDLAASWAPEITKILGQAGIHNGTIVDLGCGGGGGIAHLLEAGYQAVGVDISPAMIERCRRRVPSGSFHVGSIWDYAFPHCCAVTALGEVICYRSENRHEPDLATLFDNVFNALAPGGQFILDIAEVGLDHEREPTFFEGEDWACLVRFEYDFANDRLHRNITSFRKTNTLYRRSRERHTLQLYEPSLFAKKLEGAGFRVRPIRNFGAASMLPKRLGFIASKTA